ncbi:MAG: ankyrin repeat domain-containing protein, partial [Candidatus Micrarchaeota archaeon]
MRMCSKKKLKGILLHKAASKGIENIARMLIRKGADVNTKSADGLTPLHDAAYNGHTGAVKLLIEKGADMD